MSIGFLEEREGHKSIRRLIMVACSANASALVVVGMVFRDMALIGAGVGLWGAILPTLQWMKTMDRPEQKVGT